MRTPSTSVAARAATARPNQFRYTLAVLALTLATAGLMHALQTAAL